MRGSDETKLESAAGTDDGHRGRASALFEKEALDDARWLEDQFVPDSLAGDRKAALRFVIDGHLKILLEIGAIDGVSFIPALGSAKVALLTAPRLTAHGHELLNALRQPKLWNAIKTCAIQTGLGSQRKRSKQSFRRPFSLSSNPFPFSQQSPPTCGLFLWGIFSLTQDSKP